jgi:glucose-6-phosphate-specific signal transduction histidine kinase
VSVPTAPPSPLGLPPRDPWFHRRPHLALAVIGALYAAVFTVRLLSDSTVDAYSMFYVLPVALAATAFGQRGGLVSSLLAIALIVVYRLISDVSHTPVGWATRVVPLLLLGILLGRATDRARAAEAERSRHGTAALLHREAIEINDSLIQRMTVAKWALEAGRDEAALRALTDAVHEAHRLVSDLIRRADMGERAELISEVAEEP